VVVVQNPQWMYNLTVDVAHTYYVGDGEWLVHNANCKLALGLASTIEQEAEKNPELSIAKKILGHGIQDPRTLGTGILGLMDDAESIHFFTRGMLDKPAQWYNYGKEGIGVGNITHWEFYQIMSNPNYLAKTTFYDELNNVMQIIIP
jgi:hypothetical protein